MSPVRVAKRTSLCAGVIAIAAIAYYLIGFAGVGKGSGKPTSLSEPLERLPMELNGWVGEDVRLPDEVVLIAGADTYLRRDYSSRSGRASLYVAYYGNVHDAVPHGPTICYPSAGWATRKSELLALPSKTPGLGELQVQKLLYERDFAQVAVLYWYAANREQQAGTQWLRYDAARRKLLGLGGAYVVQVMVSTPVAISEERAFALIERFWRDSFDSIARHFPQPDPGIQQRQQGEINATTQ